MQADPWRATPDADAPRLFRSIVAESWARSRRSLLDPEHLLPPIPLDDDELRAYREAHPLAAVVPVIRRLLVRDAEGSGLLIAMGDERGRLLWVEGDAASRTRAEQMHFMPGADWAEARAGTSAPGTALALDHGIQIHDTEHFNHLVHGWSCTAVPIHDPETRRILGVLDLTGDQRAIDPHTLPLIEATVAAAEAELMIQRLRARQDHAGRSPAPMDRVVTRRTARVDAAVAVAPPASAGLHVIGRGSAELVSGDAHVLLSPRHSEILTLLAWNRDGLTVEAIGELVWAGESSPVTVRAEVLRLRKMLETSGFPVRIESRPYRLTGPLDFDVHRVIALLDRGAHRVALATYRGSLLPGSDAPGIVELRETLRLRLREALLASASADVLFEFAATPDGADDADVLRELLRVLPARSPRRAGIVAQLETLAG